MSFYQYTNGPEPIAALGLMMPFGDKILCYALLESDGYKGGGLTIPTFNATDAACFEIVAVGQAVARKCEDLGEEPLRPGEHVTMSGVAGDRVYNKDITGRYWLVPFNYVHSRWDPIPLDTPGLRDACDAQRYRGDMVRAQHAAQKPNIVVAR